VSVFRGQRGNSSAVKLNLALRSSRLGLQSGDSLLACFACATDRVFGRAKRHSVSVVMKKELYVSGIVAGSLLTAGSIWILLRAVLHAQNETGIVVYEKAGIEITSTLGESVLLTTAAFLLCAAGLALFIWCSSRLIILKRLREDREGSVSEMT